MPRSLPVVATNRDHLRSLIRQEIASNGNACNLNHIDVSAITTFEMLFREFHDFNGDISRWNVANAKSMDNMFVGSQFNGDISQWNTSNVEDMSGMFLRSQFTGDISQWDTGSVLDMSNMFKRSVFNGDISR